MWSFGNHILLNLRKDDFQRDIPLAYSDTSHGFPVLRGQILKETQASGLYVITERFETVVHEVDYIRLVVSEELVHGFPGMTMRHLLSWNHSIIKPSRLEIHRLTFHEFIFVITAHAIICKILRRLDIIQYSLKRVLKSIHLEMFAEFLRERELPTP